MADEFLLAINITMAVYAFVATIVFWFSWRKRPDFIYMFFGVIIYTIGHSLLVIKHFNTLFAYIGNGIILIALLVVVVSSIIEYYNMMVHDRKEKVRFWIAISSIVVIGAISIVIFYVASILTIINALMMVMVVLLLTTTGFIYRIYLKQETITRVFIIFAFNTAALTSISTILASYFEWGLALNIALNFIFQTFILTGGFTAIAEQRITASEEKYRNLSEHLEEKITERTQELESFSYSVSHDLRTPLRSIAGFAKILQEEHNMKLSEEGSDYLKRILKNTDRMNELINDLLDLAQVSRADFIIETLDLSKMSYDIMINLRQLDVDKQIEFTMDENIIVQGDAKLLRIALENLIGNAVKFTKSTPNAMVKFGSSMKDNQIVYFIKDNGVGFDMKYYEKLFGLFQRLHSDTLYEGTGIGLITVRRIIEKHNGKIWAESEPNKGATFYFTLAEKNKIEKTPIRYFLE